MAQLHIPVYYKTLKIPELDEKIKDLDAAENLEFFQKSAAKASTRSLLVDFGKDEAYCAVDLPSNCWSSLLETKRPSEFDVRWIIIFGPHDQPEVIKALTSTYDFTPRLSGVLNSPLKRTSASVSNTTSINHKSRTRPNRSTTHFRSDIEKNETQDIPHSTPKIDPLHTLNYYNFVSRVIHWSTFDLGAKYICLGQNNLHHVERGGIFESTMENNPDLPTGHRVWSWEILTNDKTVISIFEHPFPRKTRDGLDSEADMSPIRGNLLNVSQQLSQAYKPLYRNPVAICPVRFTVGLDDESIGHAADDPPGMLYFYVYEDWRSTYALIAREEFQYGAELNKLRDEMLKQANLEHVDRLHTTGRQLSALRRLYQSYIVLINRVLGDETSSKRRIQRKPPNNNLESTPMHFGEGYDHLEIYLSSAARVRFERLRDRIELYALTEIQECIELKDSLLSMNYNLISIKESDSLERFTRITILLAKATVLFLPVSLMTGYFSTQVQAEFTITEYWVSFVITFGISFIALLIFGAVSGTVEGNMVYRPFYKILYDMTNRKLGRTRQHDE